MDHLEDSDSEAAVRDPPSEAIREDTEEAATLNEKFLPVLQI